MKVKNANGKQVHIGRKPKYIFDDLKVGETRKYDAVPVKVMRSAISFCEHRGLKWKLKSYFHDGQTHLIRLK